MHGKPRSATGQGLAPVPVLSATSTVKSAMSTLPQSAAQRGVHHSLHDEVAARLRSMIFEGELVPGSFIDEGVLCEVLQISRTPLQIGRASCRERVSSPV